MKSAKNAKTDEPATEADPEEEGGGTSQEELPRRRFAGKKLVLFVILPVVVLLAAGAGAYFAGLTDMLFGGHQEAEVAQKPKPAVFYNLPEMLVNLNTGGRRANFLKISVSLELEDSADIPRIEAVLPRIIDNFQIYLRELRIEDLRGSAGMYRLREELLARVNYAVQPAKVRDILFKEMLVQ
ncbi:MAG TPA: flagellar basal body-associated FliL family protein [Alphaproteobacteria bacterium]